MKTKVAVALMICLLVCLAVYAQSDPNSIADPNRVPVEQPRQVVMPEGANMPVKLKCPAHGIIGKAFIAIDTDNGTKIHCTQCVKTFVSEVFEMNLPKLEIVR